MPEKTATRIVADVMLAKLARWLRLFGISVENPRYTDDYKLMMYAKRTRSILLTSDRALHARSVKNGVRSLLVENAPLEAQLAYVVGSLRLSPRIDEKICPVCNSPLRKISAESASRYTTKKIAEEYNAFYYCRKCRKVYWRGSHLKNIEATLKRVLSYRKSHAPLLPFPARIR